MLRAPRNEKAKKKKENSRRERKRERERPLRREMDKRVGLGSAGAETKE